MLISTLINILSSIISTMIGWVLPPATSVGTNTALYQSFENIFNMAYTWNYLVPITELLVLLAMAVLFWVVVVALGGVLWIIHLIRGN